MWLSDNGQSAIILRAISADNAYQVADVTRTRGSAMARPDKPRIIGRTPHGPMGRSSNMMAVIRSTTSIRPTSLAGFVKTLRFIHSYFPHHTLCRFERA